MSLNKIVKSFFLYCYIANAASLLGQNPISNYRNFTFADGLDTKTIYRFDQDKDGFVWLATDKGLYRFDGFRFKKITSPIDTKFNQVNTLCNFVSYEATTNRLWIASYSDIQYLDMNTYTFHRPTLSDNKNKYNEKYSLLPIGQDKLWYGGNGFLFEISEKNQEVNIMAKLKNLPVDASHRYTHLVNYNEELVLISSINYLLFVNKKTYAVEKTIKATNDEKFIQTNIDKATGNLWISAIQCLVKYNIKQGKKESYYFPYTTSTGLKLNNIIQCNVFLDSTHLLLTNNIAFDTEKKSHYTIRNFNDDFENKIALEGIQFKDRQGNIWRGSLHKGCNVLIANDKNVSLYGPLQNNDGINIEPYTSMMDPSSAKIYVAGGGISGLLTIDLKEKTIANLRNRANEVKGKINVVYDIALLNGQLYNCDDHNINKIVGENFIPLLLQNDGIMESFKGIEKLKPWANKLIAVSQNAHFVIDVKNGRYAKTMLDSIDGRISSSFNPYFYPLCTSKDGTIWYGSTLGLYAQKVGESKPRNVKLKNGNITLDISIVSAAIDRQERLWLGTISNGVWIYNPLVNQVHKIGALNEEFKLEGINKLTIDENNIAYIGAQNGIYKFDASTENFIGVMNRQNGFIVDDAGYEIKHQGDNMITLNSYPYVVLYNSQISQTKLRSKIVLTSLKIANAEIINKPTDKLTKLKLKYPDQSFELEFSDLNLVNSSNPIFKYRLEGLDTEWIISKSNKINYHRIPSGQYRLAISNLESNSNNASIDSLYVDIEVCPPFWKTGWFISLCFATFIGTFYFFYHQKMKALSNEMNIKSNFERKIASLEMKALRAQMNPHFIFNSLNSIQKFIFEKDEYAASQYLTKFSRLIRLILDQSNQELTTLVNEMDLIKIYIEMESLRFDHQFEFAFNIDSTIPMDFKLPSMIIQPHIENAIWHGLLHKEDKGLITLTIEQKNAAEIFITIVDNGIGRDQAYTLKSKQILKKKSYGSKISEDRIKIFNESHGLFKSIQIIDLKDDQGIAQGTKIIIPVAYSSNTNSIKEQNIL